MKESRIGTPKKDLFGANRRRATNETAKIIGERLSFYRAKKEITQQQLADRYGVSKNAMSNYERGVITPSLNIIFDIADGLNMTLDEFFGFTPPKQHTLEEEVLLNYFNAADEKARDIIIEASRTISKAYPADTE